MINVQERNRGRNDLSWNAKSDTVRIDFLKYKGIIFGSSYLGHEYAVYLF